MRKFISLIAAVVVSCVLFAAPTEASLSYNGTIGVQAPAGAPDRYSDNSTALLGRLQFPKLLGPIGLTLDATYQLRQGTPFSDNNRFRATLDLPVTPHLTFYTAFDRRYSANQNEVLVGVKFPFCGHF